MTTSGEILAFEKITTGSETTPEYMRTIIKAFVDSVCEIAGNLQIIERLTEEHEKGVFYYVGEKGSDYPLFCVGNSTQTSYYYKYIFIGGIRRNNEPFFNKNSSSTSGDYFSVETSYKHYFSYIKSDKTFLFSMRNENQSAMPYAVITQISNGTEIKKGFVLQIGSNPITSLIPGFTNTGGSYQVLSANELKRLSPASKDAMLDYYIGGEEKILNMKLFTNSGMAYAGCRIMISGKMYAVAFYSSSYVTWLVEIE